MENVLWKWVVVVCLDSECLEFVITGWYKVNFYDFINCSWSKQSETMLVVIKTIQMIETKEIR